MNRSLLLLALLTLGAACDKFGLSRRAAEPQRIPLLLSDLNTPYDDYNSALPRNTYGTIPLVFSSTRGDGKHFKLVYEMLSISYDDKSRSLKAHNRPYGGLDVVAAYLPLFHLSQRANDMGAFNVLGPQTLLVKNEHVLLFADDREGNLNVRFTHNLGEAGARHSPEPVAFLNSPADDAYPSFDPDSREIYFTSNRDGPFDIYRAVLPDSGDVLTSLRRTQGVRIEKVPELSSAADDKCPYRLGDRMVLVSDRPGGLGGFDIYVSRLVNGRWTTPVNAGPRINTAHDEYRPALTNPRHLASFTYPLMVFSSNRPGGKGGFDLYLVGLLDD